MVPEQRSHVVGAVAQQLPELAERHVEIAQEPDDDARVELLDGVQAVASEWIGEGR